MNKINNFNNLIAEELFEIAPRGNCVTFNDKGQVESYNKSDLVPPLINELQKQNKEIEKQKKEIESLKMIIDSINKRLYELESK